MAPSSPSQSGASAAPDAEPDDGMLVSEVARGQLSALATLYDRHAGMLLSTAHRMLGNETAAEDLVQDVLMEVWRRAHAFDASRGSVRTWMLVRLRSRAVDRLRSARHRREVPVEEVVPREPAPSHEDPELSPDRALVRQVLAELPEDQRTVIELAYFHGLSSSEIAEHMGSPIGTVKSRTAAALGKLRAAMSVMPPSEGGRA
ncbi:sigma-70 family RNA polymerase sigma factor [Paraliomyxa miuraensis]|uniref:sigma-70 family RNA polymerase sigma factor n=1 Tax=Paraliomyxa miuraensis TaxID=376150 RepID=UPI00224DB1B8|nr:sigma-70 family RNA polymerase sigma factor [Paraliomyxa miuraensis]MCX4239905.1 sigma-70 family RNA polymerase sigma factor [Paraliomyxa miuraensis]